jgi:succinoglycan biosynthesis transport protein ExoP
MRVEGASLRWLPRLDPGRSPGGFQERETEGAGDDERPQRGPPSPAKPAHRLVLYPLAATSMRTGGLSRAVSGKNVPVEAYEPTMPPLAAGEPGDQPIELGRYGRALKRNWLLMALIVVPLTALVLVFSLMVGKTYRATARVVLSDNSPLAQTADPAAVQRQLATIQALTTTRSVLTKAAQNLHGESIATLEHNVTASVDQTANIINVSATDRDPRVAAATANAVARAYLDERRAEQRLQLAADRASLIRLMQSVRNAPGGAAQARAIQDRLSELSIQAASAGSDLQLAQPARPPSTPYSPQPVRNAVFAFFAATFLAVLAALAREHFVRRLDGPRELSRLLRLPVLSSVPLTRNTRRSRRRRHIRGSELEAYDSLTASLEFQLPPTKQRTLLVTSALPGEGKSEVTARLGQALVHAGHSTLLVDADLRRPALHEFFDTPEGPGLPGLLRNVQSNGDSGASTLVEKALADARVSDRLSVLTTAETSPGRARLLGGDGGEALAIFDELSRYPFEYIIVDGPPLLGIVDAQIMAQLVDHVLLVARIDQLTVENVHDLRALLDRSDINALGLFVVGAQNAGSQYYLTTREPVLEEA